MYGDLATKLIRHITQDDSDIIPSYQYQLVEQVMRENDELYAENLRTSQSVQVGAAPSTVGGNGTNHGDAAKSDATTTNATKQSTDKEPEPQPSTSSTNGKETIDLKQPTDDTQAPHDDIDIGEKELMVMQVRHTAKLWNKRCIIAYHYERLNRLKKLRWEYGNNLPREIVEKLSKEELEWFTTYNDNLFSYMSALNDGRGLDLTLYVAPPKKLYIQVKCIRDYGQFDLEDGQPVMLKKDSIHYLPLSQCEKLIHQGVLEQTSL